MVLVVTCNCGFNENRRNQRKLTPKGGGNSPKSGDDPIGQVFVYVITGSNGFQRVVVLPIGSVRKATFPYSRFRIFWIFFKFLALRCGFPFSNGARTPKSGFIFIYTDRKLGVTWEGLIFDS